MSDAVYNIITQQFLDRLDKGLIPWRMPWSTSAPMSLATGKEYTGVNVMMLGMQGYKSKWWLTDAEVKRRGGQIKKREDGKNEFYTPILYVHVQPDRENEDGEIVRGYTKSWFYKGYNKAQVEGVEFPPEDDLPDFKPIERLEAFLAALPAPKPLFYERKSGRCYYSPYYDKVIMQPRQYFASELDWYRTRLHEEAHATGHSSRLAREFITKLEGRAFGTTFGSFAYAKEELTAEIAVAMALARLGIQMEANENAIAYVQNWAQALRNDRHLVTGAASLSQKVVDYWMGKSNVHESETEQQPHPAVP